MQIRRVSQEKSCESLTWVLVDNAPTPVSRFVDVRPRQRPTALCPQCERPVTLKLGRIRGHHAAHRPGDRACLATQPESALHISVKCHIAEELRRAGREGIPLIVAERCVVGGSGLPLTLATLLPHERSASPCEAVQEHLVAQGWDAVVLERRIAGHERDADATIARTPDIVLLKQGVPILAIEVFVTHRVDEIKAQALAALGVPWAEVQADQSLISTAPWRYDVPRPIAQLSGHGLWRCARHQREHEEWIADEARRRELEAREEEARLALAAANEERRRELFERLAVHTTTVRGVRIADFYLTNGQRRRRYYFVTEEAGYSGRHIALVEGESTVASWAPDFESEDSRRRVWQALRDAWQNDCRELQREEHSTMDSPMQWLHGPLAMIIATFVRSRTAENVRALLEAFPPRFESARDGPWVGSRSLRDLSWDGQQGETLCVHPSVAR
ncbi:MAG: competence protein CoiA family protein [bacterium]